METQAITLQTICHGGVPECALFEADGGAWKLDAVLIIKHWLEEQALGLPVVA